MAETLEDCAVAFGADRAAAVAREVTKLHETTYRGALGDLAARAGADPNFTRGEIVLVVHGAPPAPRGGGDDGHGGALDRTLSVLLAALPLKQAAALAAKLTGARDNEAYKRALHLKGN